MKQQLTGLIICGGQSSRMGTDKSILEYYGKPQRYYLYDWLQQFCEEVYISCNAEQAKDIPGTYRHIADKDEWAGMGPMTGLLSAHASLPARNFLVIGCDYPLLEHEDIHLLTESFDKYNSSVAYRNDQGFIEPLIAIYRASDLDQLTSDYSKYHGSLNRFLKEVAAVTINPKDAERIKSIDTYEDYMRFKQR